MTAKMGRWRHKAAHATDANVHASKVVGQPSLGFVTDQNTRRWGCKAGSDNGCVADPAPSGEAFHDVQVEATCQRDAGATCAIQEDCQSDVPKTIRGPAPEAVSQGGEDFTVQVRPGVVNEVATYTAKILRSEFTQCDVALHSDILTAMSGGSVYLPGLFCDHGDMQLFRQLLDELRPESESSAKQDADCTQWTKLYPPTQVAEDGVDHVDERGIGGLVNHSQHLKHEDPSFSKTFRGVMNAMSAYFDVEICATRLNYYRKGTDWKPFHHDSHAYAAGKGKEDFTMGVSFGAMRELAFRHEGSGALFSFPQRNGDVFAFDSEVNKKFMHGVPRASASGPRISVVAWGRRRSFNPRNSSVSQGESSPPAGIVAPYSSTNPTQDGFRHVERNPRRYHRK